jgi:hypothetical protein
MQSKQFRRQQFFAMLVSIALLPCLAWAAAPAAIAVVGAGTAGNWVTEIDMANPTDQTMITQVDAMDVAFIAGCPGDFCNKDQPPIAGNGTATTLDSQVGNAPQNALHTLYIVSKDPSVVPVVRARARNVLNPQLTTELPTVRMDTLANLGGTTLNFPSAIRSSHTHVNLVIAAIVPDGGGPAFTARVEAYSPDGTLLGGMNVSNDTGGAYSPNIFLVDVLAQLGVSDLADGQIKVTKLSGEGSLWGGMAIVYPAGVVALGPGLNP